MEFSCAFIVNRQNVQKAERGQNAKSYCIEWMKAKMKAKCTVYQSIHEIIRKSVRPQLEPDICPLRNLIQGHLAVHHPIRQRRQIVVYVFAPRDRNEGHTPHAYHCGPW
jgi:hypothetical protein